MSEVSEPSSDDLTVAIKRILKENSLATLITVIEAPHHVGAKLLVEENGARIATLGDVTLDDAVTTFTPKFLASQTEAGTYTSSEFAPDTSNWRDVRILCERIEPEPRLVICGAGHVGASLALMARVIGYGVTLIDDRVDFVTRKRFLDEGVELVVADKWKDALTKAMGAGRNVAVAVVTRGHNEDEECMRAVVETQPDYMGLIGSKRRTNIVLDRLRASGADDKVLDQVRAPIGLDIGAVSPEEVALAILAEIVAERRGAKGASLSAWRRKPKTGDET